MRTMILLLRYRIYEKWIVGKHPCLTREVNKFIELVNAVSNFVRAKKWKLSKNLENSLPWQRWDNCLTKFWRIFSGLWICDSKVATWISRVFYVAKTRAVQILPRFLPEGSVYLSVAGIAIPNAIQIKKIDIENDAKIWSAVHRPMIKKYSVLIGVVISLICF